MKLTATQIKALQLLAKYKSAIHAQGTVSISTARALCHRRLVTIEWRETEHMIRYGFGGDYHARRFSVAYVQITDAGRKAIG